MILYWYIITNWSPQLIYISSVFFLLLLLVPGPHPGDHVVFRSPVSLGSAGLCSVSDHPYFQWPCQFWGVLVRHVFRIFSYWDLSEAFLIIRLGFMGFGRKTTEITCHSHHIILRLCPVNMTSLCWYWPWSPGWGCCSESLGQLTIHILGSGDFDSKIKRYRWQVVSTDSPWAGMQ